MSTSTTIREEENSFVVQWLPLIKRWWFIAIRHWYIFILSTLCCLIIGWFYANTRTQRFSTQSVILIEDAQTLGGNASNGAVNALLQLNGVSVGDNLVNESFILSSRRLMRNVVDSLNLNVDYTTKLAMRHTTLYNERPFTIVFAQRNPRRPLSFDAEVVDRQHVRLFNFSEGSPDFSLTAKVGTIVHSPVGILHIQVEKSFTKFPFNTLIHITQLPFDMAAERFQSQISAKPYDRKSSLVLLTCTDVHPERPADILTEIYNAYKVDVVNNKNRMAQNTAQFIDERIAIIGQELGQVESEMAQFKRDNQVVDFAKNATTALSESSDARRKVLQLETEKSVAQYLLDFLIDHAHENEVIPVLSGGNLGDYGSYITEYNRLVLQRNQTLANTTATSPIIKQLDTQLSALRHSIIAAIRSQVDAISLQLRDARKVDISVRNILTGAPLKEKQGLDIQRQQELKNALYTFLLNKREEVALQLSINEANVRLVELPSHNNTPIYPPKTVIYSVAFALGLFFPMIYLFIINLLNNTIASRQEVEELLTIPILGEIPHWDTPDKNTLIDQIASSSPIVEAFRILRFNLNFIGKDTQVIAITSSTPSQGKTFLSLNFATAIAMANKRVLIIDADIRKRTLSTHHLHEQGLTSFLIDNNIRLSDIILPNGLTNNVDFIPAGPTPPNPSEILLLPRFQALITEVKALYDYILIDTTPFLSVSDASIVSQQADLTLYVLRVGVQTKSFLPYLQKLYDTRRVHNLTLVINDSDDRTEAYGYGYGYGYPYNKEVTLRDSFMKWFRLRSFFHKKK